MKCPSLKFLSMKGSNNTYMCKDYYISRKQVKVLILFCLNINFLKESWNRTFLSLKYKIEHQSRRIYYLYISCQCCIHYTELNPEEDRDRRFNLRLTIQGERGGGGATALVSVVL